jgi:hypothetical protein
LKLPDEEDGELNREQEQRLERRPQRWRDSIVFEIGLGYPGRTAVSGEYRFD